MTELRLRLGKDSVGVPIGTVIVAGFAGRDSAGVEEHIVELAALGVPRPSRVPLFYRVSTSRLTTAPEVESSAAASGEVEALLLRHAGRLWVGVGSDHTDREVEIHSIAVAKQMCDKPMAPDLWPFEEVAPHWDELVLRAWIDGDVLYQEGTLASLLAAGELAERAEPPLEDGTVMLCGTVPVIGGIRRARSFSYELADPVLDRSIAGSYTIREVPLVS
jgi:hypothetical protein